MDLFNSEIDLFTNPPKEEIKEEHIKVNNRYGYRQLTRKLTSEKNLDDALNWHFRDGDCYHCFSFGDVDAMTFFKFVLKQQHINFALMSSWVMAGEDVDDLESWYDRGFVDRVDFYMGEIFKNSYSNVYRKLRQFATKENGRICLFKNHSKIMAIKGERFDVLIESSANVNTNPRCENTVLTVDSELVNDYINLFSEIVPFNRDTCGADPFKIKQEKSRN